MGLGGYGEGQAMNDIQRERLEEHVNPGHECNPFNGGCHLPHYWHNHTSARYLVQWPMPSAAMERVMDAREERDWGTGD